MQYSVSCMLLLKDQILWLIFSFNLDKSRNEPKQNKYAKTFIFQNQLLESLYESK